MDANAPGLRQVKKSAIESVSVWDIFLFAFGFCIIASTCTFIALFIYQKGVNVDVRLDYSVTVSKMSI